jgi:hypothetical protein
MIISYSNIVVASNLDLDVVEPSGCATTSPAV